LTRSKSKKQDHIVKALKVEKLKENAIENKKSDPKEESFSFSVQPGRAEDVKRILDDITQSFAQYENMKIVKSKE